MKMWEQKTHPIWVDSPGFSFSGRFTQREVSLGGFVGFSLLLPLFFHGFASVGCGLTDLLSRWLNADTAETQGTGQDGSGQAG